MRHKRGNLPTRQRTPVTMRRLPRHDVALLDHLLTTAPIGFAFLDRNFCFVRASSALNQIYGLSMETHVGRSLSEAIGHENWNAIESYCRAALHGVPTCDVEISSVVAPHSGTQRNVLASYYPIRDKGDIIGVGIGIKDITERLQAERERMDLIAQIHEAGAQRRTFLSEMLVALTEGKLNLCHSPEQLPQPLMPLAPPAPLSPELLSFFRHQIIDAGTWLKFSEDRTADFVLAAGEALDNVLVHAGEGTAQVLVDEHRGVLQVRVVDSGCGINECDLHRAALERGYTTAGSLGHGFFLILNTCDRVWMLTGHTGTTIVLEQDRNPPLPAWLLAS